MSHLYDDIMELSADARVHVLAECTVYSDSELEALYDDCLDECYDAVVIGDLTYMPSHVLRLVDPVAYRCGLSDWADGDFIELGSDMYQSEDVERALAEWAYQQEVNDHTTGGA